MKIQLDHPFYFACAASFLVINGRLADDGAIGLAVAGAIVAVVLMALTLRITK
jgi:hypothetical protein